MQGFGAYDALVVSHVVCPCEAAFNFILALRSGLSEASTSNISISSRKRHWLVAERRTEAGGL